MAINRSLIPGPCYANSFLCSCHNVEVLFQLGPSRRSLLYTPQLLLCLACSFFERLFTWMSSTFTSQLLSQEPCDSHCIFHSVQARPALFHQHCTPKISAPVPALSPFFFIYIRSKPLPYFNNPISSIFLSISKMLFTTVAALLFSSAVMAAPARKPVTKEGECTPVTLTLTEFVIAESASYNYVSFNAHSEYIANSPADDVLRRGVNCEADGVTLPSGDIQCNIGGHRVDDLTFQLLYSPRGRAYKLDHMWQCDGYVPQPSPIVQVD